MNGYVAVTIALVLMIIIATWLLLRQNNMPYQGVQLPHTAKTARFEVVRKVARCKLELVKSRSGVLQPYNATVMDACDKALRNANTWGELATAFLLMPNNSIGTYPLQPIKNLNETILFQFEQGTAGWYWGYATYSEANIMYYIVRIDVGTPEIRARYNLPIGATTIYSLSVGVGRGKDTWQYSPFIMVPGTYEMYNDTEFRFTAEWEEGQLTFSGSPGRFDLEFSIDKSQNNKTPFSASLAINQPTPTRPSMNGKDGCAPCVSGSGTLYWSYTQLDASSAVITIDGDKTTHSNGDAWLDRQWLRGNDPRMPLIRLITNISQLSHSVGGLGRYMWINLHVDTDVQYMIVAFPNESISIKKGQEYSTQTRMYSAKLGNSVKGDGTLKIEEITNIQGINFPSIVTVSVESFGHKKHEYTVDTTPYGKCVTIDLTGNLHWSGSASLTSKGKTRGTAFVELNHFQDDSKYVSTTMEIAKIPRSSLHAFQGAPLKTIQVLPSILVLTIVPLLVLILITLWVIYAIVAAKKHAKSL